MGERALAARVPRSRPIRRLRLRDAGRAPGRRGARTSRGDDRSGHCQARPRGVPIRAPAMPAAVIENRRARHVRTTGILRRHRGRCPGASAPRGGPVAVGRRIARGAPTRAQRQDPVLRDLGAGTRPRAARFGRSAALRPLRLGGRLRLRGGRGSPARDPGGSRRTHEGRAAQRRPGVRRPAPGGGRRVLRPQRGRRRVASRRVAALAGGRAPARRGAPAGGRRAWP